MMIAPVRQRDPSQQVLKVGPIVLVPDQWNVYVDDAPVHLTETEFRLLQLLLEVEGRVITRRKLLTAVWGSKRSGAIESRTLDVHMSRLRNKLGTSAERIITVRNIGYRIDIAAK